MIETPFLLKILARLAVASEYKGCGLGRALLKDALIRTLQASDIAGLRAIVAHAKDSLARKFYLKHGFEESILDEYHVMIPIQDIELTAKN